VIMIGFPLKSYPLTRFSAAAAVSTAATYETFYLVRS